MKLPVKHKKMFPVILFLVFGIFLSIYLRAMSEDSVPTSTDFTMFSNQEEQIKAPDFVLKDITGRSVRLRDLRGNLVMINFWTTW